VKLIMENFRNYRGDKILEAMEHRGFYVTTRDPFLKAIGDMATYTIELGDIEAAKEKVKENVDAKKYSNHHLRSLLARGYFVARGIYVTTKEKFLEALDDAGQLAMQGESLYSVKHAVERNVDQGKYSDPKSKALTRGGVIRF